MDSKGHNRPTRIVDHDKTNKDATEGHPEQVNQGKTDERDNAGSKVGQANGARTPENDTKPKQNEVDRNGEVTSPIEKDDTGTATKDGKEDTDGEKGKTMDHPESSDQDKDETGEGSGKPSVSTTPEPTDPEDFDSRSFLQSVKDLHVRLRSATSHSGANEEFPADELKLLVQDATTTLNNFKNYSVHSQSQLEDLRHEMEEVGHRIARQVQMRTYTPDTKSGR